MALRYLAMRSYQQRELVSPCIFQMSFSTGRERPALARNQLFLSSRIRGGRHMESTYKGVDSKASGAARERLGKSTGSIARLGIPAGLAARRGEIGRAAPFHPPLSP